ncbi:MAG: hypothetical protein LBD92_03690 [Oscillospiraceae bacterium]|jgi:hypothetical protein|nr:hypothetical protein [Oscillospiraceae bacterium]
MTYERPAYLDPGIKTQTVKMWFGPPVVVPVFDTPITPRENFRRAISRRDPVWFPNAVTDTQSVMANDVMGRSPTPGMQIHSDLGGRGAAEDYDFKDWFGAEWTWVCSAGGAMLKPGTKLLEDITVWERDLVWPDLSQWGFAEKADRYMKSVYDERKALTYDIGRGMTERLVSLLGGYTDGMLALATEPEAVRDFFDRYSGFVIDTFDAINALYPLDMVTLHDDWGAEKDTFFSERMMEELVFEPTKRIIDHIHSKEVLLELHSCGNVTRFMPYIIEMGADVAQLQRRAVDLPLMREKYGNKLGYCLGVEGVEPGKNPAREELIAAIRKTLDIFAPGGGSYINVFSADPELGWAALAETYYYGREKLEVSQSFGAK